MWKTKQKDCHHTTHDGENNVVGHNTAVCILSSRIQLEKGEYSETECAIHDRCASPSKDRVTDQLDQTHDQHCGHGNEARVRGQNRFFESWPDRGPSGLS